MNWHTQEVSLWLFNDRDNYDYLMELGEEMLVKDEYDFRVMLIHEFNIPNKDVDFSKVDVEELKSQIGELI